MTEITGKYEVEDSTENAMEMIGAHEDVRVKDESNDRRYFTITPRIVKAYARNPHDLAFWETVKDIAGEEGECYLNTEQMAILGGMSTGQVSKSRRYWLKIGFLKGETRKDPGYSQSVWHLSVPDLWAKNVEWCERHPKIEDRLAFRKVHKSLHRVKPSPSEGKPSPSETKKMLIKKNHKLGDLVDGFLDLAQSPGIKRDARIDSILSYLGGKLKINTETKRWKDFARFADDRQQAHHEPLDVFVSWVMRHKNFDIQFWPPSKMQEMWPQAFLAAAEETESEYQTL
jgi:hypothetical protein